MRNPTRILITGASSGIGEALARAYADDGIHLALTGRDEERLNAVAEACRELGADVEAKIIDVGDETAMRAWLSDLEERHPPDLVIANAGVSGGSGAGGEGHEGARRIMDVNVDGVLNTVMPALELMRDRPEPEAARGLRGQIALMSSLAAFRGLPGAPAYSASKACVRIWGEALRGHMHADRIGVSVVCPGFVKSRMTERNKFPMPFLMDADRAARIIRRGLARNRGRIAFPWRLYFVVWLLGSLSPTVTDPLFRRSPKKS